MAIDVGTTSSRAGVFDRDGRLLGRAEYPIKTNKPEASYAEHDSADIWHSVCNASNAARKIAGARPEAFKGISFDATCSLVVRDRQGYQLSVTKTRRALLGYDQLDRSSRPCGSRRVHGDGTRGPSICRRCHVTGDAASEADVVEAAFSEALALRWLPVRSCRFLDLESLGLPSTARNAR